MTHAIERMTTDADDHISYGQAKGWMKRHLMIMAGISAAACFVGVMAVGFLSEGGTGFGLLALAVVVVLGAYGVSIGRQIIGVFDPLLSGKVLDARTIEPVAPKSDFDATVEQFDQTIERKRDATPAQPKRDSEWITADEALA